MLRTIFVALLSTAPFVFVLIQQRALRRQASVLETLTYEIKNTACFRQAIRQLDLRYFFDGLQEGSTQIAGWFWPMLAYWSSLALTSFIMFLSWNFAIGKPLGISWYVKGLNLFLVGTFSGISPDRLESIQIDTLGVACLSFEVAYVIIIGRMLVRLRTNEYSSLENLQDVVHLISCIVISTAATVLLSKINSPPTLAFFFAAGAGIRPDFYILSVGEAASAAIRAPGSPFAGVNPSSKPKLAASEMTPEVPLELIDGLSEDIVGRLRGIGITTTHRLAFSNPLIIWGRLPSSISEVVDWVGQAILLNQSPTSTKDLRRIQIRTIQDLIAGVDHQGEAIAIALELKDTVLPGFVAELVKKAEICQIVELQEKLCSLGATPLSMRKNIGKTAGGRIEADTVGSAPEPESVPKQGENDSVDNVVK